MNKNLGIYIHVPFCKSRCNYCDFYSNTCFSDDLLDKYTAKICEDLAGFANILKLPPVICDGLPPRERRGQGLQADTLYFGGGTPSLLGASRIAKIIDVTRKSFVFKNPEITLEMNPCGADLKFMQGLKSAGINRLSVGLQSANVDELEFLGRRHTAGDFKKCVDLAHRCGIENISADIILGAKNQTVKTLDKTIDFCMNLPLSHISAYILKVESGTNLHGKYDVDEDFAADLYLHLAGRLKTFGFNQYEISNFARNGQKSRHNLKYWQLDDYIGLGPAAHSCYGGKRFAYEKSLEKYLENYEFVPPNFCDEMDFFAEYVMLGLRLADGICLKFIAEEFGKDIAGKLTARAKIFTKKNLIKFEKDSLKLTTKGFLLSNLIINSLLNE